MHDADDVHAQHAPFAASREKVVLLPQKKTVFAENVIRYCKEEIIDQPGRKVRMWGSAATMCLLAVQTTQRYACEARRWMVFLMIDLLIINLLMLFGSLKTQGPDE